MEQFMHLYGTISSCFEWNSYKRLLPNAFWCIQILNKCRCEKKKKKKKYKKNTWMVRSRREVQNRFRVYFFMCFFLFVPFLVKYIFFTVFVGFGSFPLFVETISVNFSIGKRTFAPSQFIQLLYLCLSLLPVSSYSSRMLARRNFWNGKKITLKLHASMRNQDAFKKEKLEDER